MSICPNGTDGYFATAAIALVDTDDLTDEERAEMHASIERGILDIEQGRTNDGTTFPGDWTKDNL